MYELSPILRDRLIGIGLTNDEIDRKIEEYRFQAREYFSLVLSDIELTENQLNILTENYIQYKLFSMIEMESLVEDKKATISELVDAIKENHRNMKVNEDNKKNNTKRIMVF